MYLDKRLIENSRRRSRLFRQAVEMCAEQGWHVNRVSDSGSHYMTHSKLHGEIRISDHPLPTPQSAIITIDVFHPSFPYNLIQAFDLKRKLG